MEEGIDVGPVIDEGSAIRIESWIREAQAAGAKVLVGGTRDRAVVQSPPAVPPIDCGYLRSDRAPQVVSST